MNGRAYMGNPNQEKDTKEEQNPHDKKIKEGIASKPSRLAERKGQRPAFPFRRRPV